MNQHSLNGNFKKLEFGLKHLQEKLSICFSILHCPFHPSLILLYAFQSEEQRGAKTTQDVPWIYNNVFYIISISTLFNTLCGFCPLLSSGFHKCC